MLTTDQVDHFRTFGSAVLRGYLADRVGVLRAEADAAIRDAYAATSEGGGERGVIDGISGPLPAHGIPADPGQRVTRLRRPAL